MRCASRNIMDVFLIAFIGLSSINWSNAFLLSRELPCKYLESINITDGIKQKDGNSILFNGMKFTEDQYTTVNYMIVNGSIRVSVKPHIRGCVCNKRPCIRLCCPYGTFKVGRECRSHDAAKRFEAEILDANNRPQNVILDDNFTYVDERPCSNVYRAYNYTITHTGHVLHENKSVSHLRYCMLTSLNKATNKPNIGLAICFESADQLEARFNILPIGMLLSVPFIIATFLVYICLPELRNLHGKCLLCYLLGLVIGYTAMALVQLNGSNYVEAFRCKSLGYLIYFSFLSAFLWLSVISFDLWWNFRTTNGFQYSERKRFFLYMLYAWGLSIFLTIFIFIVDSTQSLSASLRPGIGDQTCFLKKTIASQFVFFYMPLCIICSVNIMFFVLTALKIRKVQQDLKRVTSQEESARHQSKFNRDKDNFTLYLRLFIVMGVTWSMEGISFLISPESDFFLLTDICNTIQGVLIFVLFVMKRRVLRLIKKRWQGFFGKATTNGSVATNSTSATYAPSNLTMNQITASK